MVLEIKKEREEYWIDNEQLLLLPDVMLNIAGLVFTTHDLASLNWQCRVRFPNRKFGNTTKISFYNDQKKSTITIPIKTKQQDIFDLFALISTACGRISHKQRGWMGLDAVDTKALQQELCQRHVAFIEDIKHIPDYVLNAEYEKRFGQTKSEIAPVIEQKSIESFTEEQLFAELLKRNPIKAKKKKPQLPKAKVYELANYILAEETAEQKLERMYKQS